MEFYLIKKRLRGILFDALVLALVFTLVSPVGGVALAQTDATEEPQPEVSTPDVGGVVTQDQSQPQQTPEPGDATTITVNESVAPADQGTVAIPTIEESATPADQGTAATPAAGDGQSSGNINGKEPRSLTGTVVALNDLGAIVVDEAGDPQPMASQKAVDVLSASDPYFTRSNVTFYYQPVGGCGTLPNCVEAANPVQAALTDLQTNGLPDDGVLNIEAGTYDGFEVTGFINPTGGSLMVYSADGVGAATFTDMVHIYNNVGLDLTLSGINVYTTSTAAILVENNLDSDFTLQDVDVQNDGGAGIVISGQGGNVSLKSVKSSGNAGDGIYIVGVDRNVSLDTVIASDNDDWGIYMDSIDGDVTLGDVTTNNNGAWGVDIGYVYGNVNLDGVETNFNGEDGVYVGEIDGDLSLTGITANQNDWVGIFLEEVLGDVQLTDIVANQNGDAGVVATYIYGSVGMSNVTAELNAGDGVGVAGVLENLNLKNMTMRQNGMAGIYIEEIYGDATLAEIVAEMNDEAGVYLTWIGGNVHLWDILANQNENGVLVSLALGDDGVSMSNVTAEENDELGVGVALVLGNVRLKDVIASLNGDDGVYIDTVNGSVKLANVVASENGGYGIYVEDLVGNIYMDNVTFNNNAIDGIYVDTLGKVHVCFSQFNDNTGYGLNVSAGNGLYMYGETTAGNTAGDINLRDSTTLTILERLNCFPASSVKKTSDLIYLKGDIIVDFHELMCGNTAPKAMIVDGKFIGASTLPTSVDSLPGGDVLGVVRTMVPPCAPDGYTYTISLKLPGGSSADNIQALAWVEGQGWVELPTTLVDGRLVVEVASSGMFAFLEVEP